MKIKQKKGKEFLEEEVVQIISHDKEHYLKELDYQRSLRDSADKKVKALKSKLKLFK